jgi:hypothetical protein
LIALNNIQKKYVSVALLLALLFPLGVQLGHAFDGHKHTLCKDITTHIHEKKLDCSICDFHYSTPYFNFLNSVELVAFKNFNKPQTLYISSESNINFHSFYLRGPPILFNFSV